MVATRLRAAAFTSLAAATAAVAHGGLAGITRPGWAIPALAGSSVATLVMWRGWTLLARSRELPAPAASLAALIPAMLAAQTAAHEALLAAGLPAHRGASGALALHLALAVVAALLVHRIDVHTIDRAARARAAAPVAACVSPRPMRPQIAPRGTAGLRPVGRAPPATA